jgi:hypothetical protein
VSGPAALCLVAAAAASPVAQVPLPAGAFTLAWTHSIEKVSWEEDYLVAGGWLFLLEARVHGSAAGMEVPDGARLAGGVWHYRPAERWHRELRLTRSGFTTDYRLCVAGECRELGHWAPLRDGGLTIARDCAAGPSR